MGAYAKAEGAKPAVIVFTSKHHDKASEAARKELRQVRRGRQCRRVCRHGKMQGKMTTHRADTASRLAHS